MFCGKDPGGWVSFACSPRVISRMVMDRALDVFSGIYKCTVNKRFWLPLDSSKLAESVTPNRHLKPHWVVDSVPRCRSRSRYFGQNLLAEICQTFGSYINSIECKHQTLNAGIRCMHWWDLVWILFDFEQRFFLSPDVGCSSFLPRRRWVWLIPSCGPSL